MQINNNNNKYIYNKNTKNKLNQIKIGKNIY